MAKNNNAPAQAGATPEGLEPQAQTQAGATPEGLEPQTQTQAGATPEGLESQTQTQAGATPEGLDAQKAQEKLTPVNGEFEVDRRKYKLSDRCPAKLQFNGKVYTREELLTSEEIQKSLVIGESPFVKKI